MAGASPAWTALQEDSLAIQVTIYRDNYGIPHIVGDTEEATFFGYGYAQAEDHLESMMLRYRDAQGRRAEVERYSALGDGYLHFIPYEYRWDGDTYVLPADVIVPLLENALASHEPISDQRLSDAVEALRRWDRRSNKNSVAFTYLYYWAKVYEELYSNTKFERFSDYDRKTKVDVTSPQEQQMAWNALTGAVDRINKLWCKAEVPWGDINVVVRGGKFLLSGASELFGVLHPDYGPEQDNGQIYCNDGWGHLLIVVEGQPKKAWSLLSYGESEHSSSASFQRSNEASQRPTSEAALVDSQRNPDTYRECPRRPQPACANGPIAAALRRTRAGSEFHTISELASTCSG
jgi:acyl-homoserine lactone acylase PvdQ